MPTTLALLRDRVEQTLSDTGNTIWSTTDLDEAIRIALDEYTQVSPHHAIATLTLSAAGREISLTSITALLHVLRVWWKYTSTDPEYPPQWREFEQWPGPLLFINDGIEPASGDVVRIFYTARHTLNGLDSATATTLPDEHVSLIVAGAAGQAALSYAQAMSDRLTVDGWTSKRFTDYANLKLQQFTDGLRRIARQHAAQSSGIAPAYPLDRWDQ